MTDGSTALKEYLVLLDRFGLSESEVIDLHWSGSVPDDASAQAVVAHVVDEEERTPESLFDRLHRTLAASSKGVDTPKQYDPDEPGEELRDVLASYNTSVELLGPDGERLRSDGPAEPFDVVLTDASGASRSTTFAYPEGPLGTNNLPALLHDVETELLADTGMTFVPLSEREDRWRLLLLSEQRLSALRDAYGDDVEVFDRSLLHDTTLAEFAEPDPEATDELSAGSSAPDWLSGGADDAFEDVGFETAEVEDRSEAETTETKAIDQSGIDDLFDSMEATAGTASAEAEGDDEPAVADLVAGDAGAEPAATAETADPADTAQEGTAAEAETETDDEPTVTPASAPEPAVSRIAVTPGDAPTPAVHRIGVVPGADPRPAATPIAVTPGEDPTPAVERVASPPAVTPAEDPTPAAERIGVTPSSDPEPALSPIAVTPAEAPDPAVTAVEEPTPAVTPAADPEPAIEATPAVEAEESTADEGLAADESEAEETGSDDFAVAPTTGTPTPAIRLTAEAEADRLVDEEPPATEESVAETATEAETAAATETADAAAADETDSAPSPGPSVRPTDGETRAAVRPVAEGTTAKDEEAPETADASDDERRSGLLSRVAGWLRGLT